MKSTKQVEINCNVETLWAILTKAEYTKQYMFNCAVGTDWKVGSDVHWEGEFNGVRAFQKGKVISITPGQQVTYSTIDSNGPLEDIPSNYIHVSYTLHDINGISHLTISNETFDDSTERMSHIKQGWDMVIDKIKEVAETVNLVS
jgi:uncharacterized protein YndB with AHSA1/START domain